IEALGLERVGKHVAQRSLRQIRRAAREIQDLLPCGLHDPPAAERPETRKGAEQQRLVGTGLTYDENALATAHFHHRFAQHVMAGRRGDLESFDDDTAGGTLRIVMWLSTSCWISVVTTARRKFATLRSVARQSAMLLKLSTNHRSEACAVVKAAAACIRPPKESVPWK